MFGRPEAQFSVEINILGLCPNFISFLNFECLDNHRKFDTQWGPSFMSQKEEQAGFKNYF